MRPKFQQLDQDLADQIVTEAKIVLAEVGVDIADDEAKKLLADHGAGVDDADGRVRIADTMVEAALASAPSSFSLYDVLGKETHHFEGQRHSPSW
jgi:trimethylamine--corrinoid protein Co-methyltransferase